MIGSINQYVKIMEYEKKAQDKIQNYQSSFEEATGVSLPKTNGKSIKAQVAASKLASGKKLNHADMDALRREDPAAYERAMAVMRERKAYERRLKQCRSKSEAKALNAARACAFAGDAKSGNASAPSGCGGSSEGSSVSGSSEAFCTGGTQGSGRNICEGETVFPDILARSKACEDVFIQYTKTRDYKKLPLFNLRLKNIRA